MHTKVIICGGIRAGKETALKIAQLLHKEGIDAELAEEFLDVPPVMAARVKEILAGCEPPEMAGNRPPPRTLAQIKERLEEIRGKFCAEPTPNPEHVKAQIHKEALEESVSRLLKKVGKLQGKLMDKVGSENVIFDDVRMLAEEERLKLELRRSAGFIKHLEGTNKELGAELARVKLQYQELRKDRDFCINGQGTLREEVRRLLEKNSEKHLEIEQLKLKLKEGESYRHVNDNLKDQIRRMSDDLENCEKGDEAPCVNTPRRNSDSDEVIARIQEMSNDLEATKVRVKRVQDWIGSLTDQPSLAQEITDLRLELRAHIGGRQTE